MHFGITVVSLKIKELYVRKCLFEEIAHNGDLVVILFMLTIKLKTQNSAGVKT